MHREPSLLWEMNCFSTEKHCSARLIWRLCGSQVDSELVTERIRSSQAAAQHRIDQQALVASAAAAEKKAAVHAQHAAQLQADLQVMDATSMSPVMSEHHVHLHSPHQMVLSLHMHLHMRHTHGP